MATTVRLRRKNFGLMNSISNGITKTWNSGMAGKCGIIGGGLGILGLQGLAAKGAYDGAQILNGKMGKDDGKGY